MISAGRRTCGHRLNASGACSPPELDRRDPRGFGCTAALRDAAYTGAAEIYCPSLVSAVGHRALQPLSSGWQRVVHSLLHPLAHPLAPAPVTFGYGIRCCTADPSFCAELRRGSGSRGPRGPDLPMLTSQSGMLQSRKRTSASCVALSCLSLAESLRLSAARPRAPPRGVLARRRAADDTKQDAAATATATVSADDAAQNGAPAAPLPTILEWNEPDGMRRFTTNAKLAFALPQRRFKQGSYLTIRLEGDLPEKRQSRFSGNTSVALLCESIRKAAYDPRVTGIVLTVDLLSCGWAKVQEIRKYLEFFRESGKDTIAYMERGGEKEYFLATACGEIYIPPTAQLALKGLSVTGAFLRGVLDKVGVEPQVRTTSSLVK